MFAIIDPIAIATVREALTRTLANELADEFLAVYHANKLDSYRVEHADIGKRARAIPACAIWRLRSQRWAISWCRRSITGRIT